MSVTENVFLLKFINIVWFIKEIVVVPHHVLINLISLPLLFYIERIHNSEIAHYFISSKFSKIYKLYYFCDNLSI